MQFLNTLTDGHKTLLQPFGDYISLPHAILHCQYDKGSKNLLRSNHDNTEHDIHEQQAGDRRMRTGTYGV